MSKHRSSDITVLVVVGCKLLKLEVDTRDRCKSKFSLVHKISHSTANHNRQLKGRHANGKGRKKPAIRLLRAAARKATKAEEGI
ncbi:hypothetical protein ABKN59_009422 [Abortiporus biennis]